MHFRKTTLSQFAFSKSLINFTFSDNVHDFLFGIFVSKLMFSQSKNEHRDKKINFTMQVNTNKHERKKLHE